MHLSGMLRSALKHHPFMMSMSDYLKSKWISPLPFSLCIDHKGCCTLTPSESEMRLFASYSSALWPLLGREVLLSQKTPNSPHFAFHKNSTMKMDSISVWRILMYDCEQKDWNSPTEYCRNLLIPCTCSCLLCHLNIPHVWSFLFKMSYFCNKILWTYFSSCLIVLSDKLLYYFIVICIIDEWDVSQSFTTLWLMITLWYQS